MGKLKSKFYLSIFATVMVASVLTPLFTFDNQKVKAQSTYAFQSVEIQANTWSMIYALTSHGGITTLNSAKKGCAIPTNPATEDFNFWADRAPILGSDPKTRVGYHIEPEDGVIQCNNEDNSFIVNTINSWGYEDPVIFLKALGYKENSSGNLTRNNSPDISTFLGRSAIADVPVISDSFFGGNRRAYPNGPNKEVQYYIYHTNFTEGCKAVPTSKNPASALSYGEYLIKDVDFNSGEITDVIFKLDGDKSPTDSISVGWGVAPNSTGEASCEEIASKLKAGTGLAQAFSDYVKDITLAGGTAVNGEAGEGESNTGCATLVNPLSWIFCPILNLADGMVTGFLKAVKGLLEINIKDYGLEKQTSPLKTAWSSIRIISTVFLVGIALFVIISQILGFDFLSAYSVKKIVPKLVIAVILMQLSWILIVFGIELANVLGSSLQALLLAPFGGTENLSNIGNILGKAKINGWSQAAGQAILIGGATAAFFSGGMTFGIIAAVLAALIAVLVAWVVLVLRVLIIIALLVISPLAIAAWILPGTEKYFSWWWSNITKLLLMYPLIIGLITLGQIFAYIAAKAASGGGSTDGTITYMIIVVAYFGPYFFIPKTFSMSGSLMASAGNAYNKASSKLRSADIGGFRAQGEANKEMRKKAKTLKGYDDLNAEGSGLVARAQRARGAYRTKTMGGVVPNILSKRRNIPSGVPILGGKSIHFGQTMYNDAASNRARIAAAMSENEEEKNAQSIYSLGTAEIEHKAAAPEIMEDSKGTWKNQLFGVGGVNDQILSHDIGDRMMLNGQETVVTEALHRQALTDALARKDEGVIDKYIGAGGANARARGLSGNVEKWKKANFGKVDAQMTDLTRGPIATKNADNKWEVDTGNFALAFSNIDKAKYTAPEVNEAGEIISEGNTRANRLVRNLRTLAGNPANHKMLATMVTTLGQRKDLHDMDPGLLSEIGGIVPGADKVIMSAGNMRLDTITKTNEQGKSEPSFAAVPTSKVE